MFDPKPTKYPFPENTDEHYLKIKKNNGAIFDENYPYIDDSLGFKFKSKMVRILLCTIVFPMTKFKLGLKIKGKQNLKKHKKMLSSGAVVVSNHIHLWDYIAIMKAIRPKRSHVLTWAPNIRGENGTLIRLVGGIPIPENDISGSITFQKSVLKLLSDDQFVQIYAEGSMWEYYAPIRPFKTGAAYFSIKSGKPILPMAFSYRKPSWIRKNIFKQYASLTLNIGEPIFADKTLPGKEQEIELIQRCHQTICQLSGNTANIYQPLFNNSKRINYY